MDGTSRTGWVKGVASGLDWQQLALPGESEAETVAGVLLRIAEEYVDQQTKTAPDAYSRKREAILSALKRQLETELETF